MGSLVLSSGTGKYDIVMRIETWDNAGSILGHNVLFEEVSTQPSLLYVIPPNVLATATISVPEFPSPSEADHSTISPCLSLPASFHSFPLLSFFGQSSSS